MRHLSEVSSPGDWQRHGFDLSSLVFYSLSRIHLLRHLSIRFAFPVFSSGGSWQSIMKREFWCLFSRHRLLVVVHWRRGEREENSVKGARRENENVYKRKGEKTSWEKKKKLHHARSISSEDLLSGVFPTNASSSSRSPCCCCHLPDRWLPSKRIDLLIILCDQIKKKKGKRRKE